MIFCCAAECETTDSENQKLRKGEFKSADIAYICCYISDGKNYLAYKNKHFN